MSAPFDASLYTRAPKTTFDGAITLAHALARACPKGMPASVKKEHKRLLQKCERAEAAWTARHRELGTPDDERTRLVDGPTDAAWTLLRDRLAAYAALPADAFPRAARAAEIARTLFPDPTLPFLRATYAEQLTAMRGILRRIDEDGLAKDVDATCGPEFLAHVRSLMPRYEAMVDGFLARDGGSADNLRDLLRDLQATIASYATKVCATVDEDDPASAETARVALLAIANLRAHAARRSARDAGPAAPAQPEDGAPPVEPGPAEPAPAGAPAG